MITRERVDDKQGEEHIVQEQHMPTLPPGCIYSDEEVLVLGPWQRIRQRFLRPIAVVFARLGVSADMLSFASVLFGLGFFLLAPVLVVGSVCAQNG